MTLSKRRTAGHRLLTTDYGLLTTDYLKEAGDAVNVDLWVRLVPVSVNLRAWPIDDQQVALWTRTSLIELLGDLGRHSPVVRRGDKENWPVADSFHRIERVKLRAVETRATLDIKSQLIAERERRKMQKHLHVMIDRVFQPQERAV